MPEAQLFDSLCLVMFESRQRKVTTKWSVFGMNSPHSLGPNEYSTHLHSSFHIDQVILRAEVFDDSDHPNIEAAFEVPGVTPSDLKVL
jgi:hypothetical protein